MKLTKIKLYRLERGIFQWEVAKKIGIPESQLSKIENGRIAPSQDLVKKIAAALEVLPECLQEAQDYK